MPQKTRNELKEIFKTGAKPSGDDFKAFIDSTLNVSDDGIAKASGADTPLKINAQGTDEKLLYFFIQGRQKPGVLIKNLLTTS